MRVVADHLGQFLSQSQMVSYLAIKKRDMLFAVFYEERYVMLTAFRTE